MREKVLNYMKEHESITTFDAFVDLGCTRLSEYIRQIKQTHKVEDEWFETTNRYGKKVLYKRYWLAD